MKRKPRRQMDLQRLHPGACCTICGGALYPGDRYWQVNGVRSCESCLGTLAKAEFAGHAVFCGGGTER